MVVAKFRSRSNLQPWLRSTAMAKFRSRCNLWPWLTLMAMAEFRSWSNFYNFTHIFRNVLAHCIKNVMHYIRNGALHRICDALETMLQKTKRTLTKWVKLKTRTCWISTHLIACCDCTNKAKEYTLRLDDIGHYIWMFVFNICAML